MCTTQRSIIAKPPIAFRQLSIPSRVACAWQQRRGWQAFNATNWRRGTGSEDIEASSNSHGFRSLRLPEIQVSASIPLRSRGGPFYFLICSCRRQVWNWARVSCVRTENVRVALLTLPVQGQAGTARLGCPIIIIRVFLVFEVKRVRIQRVWAFVITISGNWSAFTYIKLICHG